MAAEAAAIAVSSVERGTSEVEREMEPIPGSEASTDPLPVMATEASVLDTEADGQHSSPQAYEAQLPPPPLPLPQWELACSPEAVGLELEAEEMPAGVVELVAAAPQKGRDLPPSPTPPPEQPQAPKECQELWLPIQQPQLSRQRQEVTPRCSN